MSKPAANFMMSKTRFIGATVATHITQRQGNVSASRSPGWVRGARSAGQVRARSAGQVTVEYVLLLVVGIVIWMAISQGLVSRSSSSPGLVIREWRSILLFIGNDTIEK